MSGGTHGPIGLTFYSDAEYFGGAEGYLVLLAAHLDRERYRISLVLPSAPGARILEERMRALGAAVHHLERPGFGYLRRLPEMVRVFRAAGGEVLHANLPSAYDAGLSSVAWAARAAGYRTVVTTEHLPMIDRKYRRFPVKLFFSHWVDRSIVVASANRTILAGKHGIDRDSIRVVPNGVEEPVPLAPEEKACLRSDWGAEAGTAVLGIVGRLTRRKGHHLLLEALSLLSRSPEPPAARPGSPPGEARALPEFRLVVVGEGEEEDALRAQARALGIAERVVWLGQRADAPRIVGAFDLFVLPSSVEAMPLTVLEAMAAGIPVVATAVYGVPEAVADGETGILVPPENAAALADALRRLLCDPAERVRMGRAGRTRWEERFTAARMARATEAVYEGREVAA